jgi:hypothetical protein
MVHSPGWMCPYHHHRPLPPPKSAAQQAPLHKTGIPDTLPPPRHPLSQVRNNGWNVLSTGPSAPASARVTVMVSIADATVRAVMADDLAPGADGGFTVCVALLHMPLLDLAIGTCGQRGYGGQRTSPVEIHNSSASSMRVFPQPRFRGLSSDPHRPTCREQAVVELPKTPGTYRVHYGLQRGESPKGRFDRIGTPEYAFDLTVEA